MRVKNKDLKKDVFWLIIVLLATIGISAFFLLNLFAKADNNTLDRWSKILGLSITFSGFVSIIYTLILARKAQEKQVSQATLSLFQEFVGDRFRLIRDKAWEVKNKWFKEEGYKENLLLNAFTFNQEYTDLSKFNEQILSQDMRAIYDLFTFYVVLSQYKESKETLQQCNCFLYGWWRKFLYDAAYEIEDRITIDTDKSLKEYHSHISYLPALKRLDKLMNLDRIDNAQEKDKSLRIIKDIHLSSSDTIAVSEVARS